jgi:tetratricopeptide (TPR) repeat protein
MSDPAATPAPLSEESSDNTKRAVAVMIMIVTLLGTVFAFLQSQSSNEEAQAARRAENASLQSMVEVNEAGRLIARDNLAYGLWNDHEWLRYSYDLVATSGVGNAASARVLSEVEGEVSAEIKKYSRLLEDSKYSLGENQYDFSLFYEELYAPSYKAAEFDRQYATERDSWSGKSDSFVAVITVLAVALFLLGLSSTITPAVRKGFIIAGGVVAVVATLWGATTFLRSVEKPSSKAIDAYVDALVGVNTAETKEDYEGAIALLDTAIGERPDYANALILRGNAYFSLDFLNEDGPQGSQEALADFERSLELTPDDWVSVGNVGAVHFWLGNYEESLANTEEALRLKPGDPVLTLNRVQALIGIDPERDLTKEVAAVRDVFEDLPSWLRDDTLSNAYEAGKLAADFRPELTAAEDAFLEELRRMQHEIAVSLEVNGEPTPPEVSATISNIAFVLSDDRTTLEVTFDYDGMETDDSWLYRSYINDVKKNEFSVAPDGWSFAVPSGGLVLTFTEPAGFTSGDEIRTEIFVEGNLLGVGVFEIP